MKNRFKILLDNWQDENLPHSNSKTRKIKNLQAFIAKHTSHTHIQFLLPAEDPQEHLRTTEEKIKFKG